MERLQSPESSVGNYRGIIYYSSLEAGAFSHTYSLPESCLLLTIEDLSEEKHLLYLLHLTVCCLPCHFPTVRTHIVLPGPILPVHSKAVVSMCQSTATYLPFKSPV